MLIFNFKKPFFVIFILFLGLVFTDKAKAFEGHPVGVTAKISTPKVIINELMWMGSDGDSDDEWIELRNMTDRDIDISGWQLTRLISTETLMLTIPADTTIPANGYFLISHKSKEDSKINVQPDLVDSGVVLRNSNLQIKLYKGDWTNPLNLIDTADNGVGTPAAGDSTNKYSMERNDDPDYFPGGGENQDNWHTCESTTSTTLYWDPGAIERGTPGAVNLSPNDPTSSNLEQTGLEFYLRPDRRAVGFHMVDIASYDQLTYEIYYFPANREPQGIMGTIPLSGENEVTRENLILGTDSSGDWVYDYGMDTIYLNIALSGKNISDKYLEDQIDY